jgi:hypothetical protein
MSANIAKTDKFRVCKSLSSFFKTVQVPEWVSEREKLCFTLIIWRASLSSFKKGPPISTPFSDCILAIGTLTASETIRTSGPPGKYSCSFKNAFAASDAVLVQKVVTVLTTFSGFVLGLEIFLSSAINLCGL